MRLEERHVRERPARRGQLPDGDVIEAGQTFFVYRARNPLDIGAQRAWFAESSTGELPLTTFVPTLASQYHALAQIAASMVPVVVLGESGTGKEVIARAVHRMSSRDGPFVAVNCGAIPGEPRRERAVRLQEGRVLRRDRGSPRPRPRGRRRHAVPRRDRRAAGELAGRAAARAAGARGHAGRRHAAGAGRCPRRRRDAPALDDWSTERFRHDLFARLAGLMATRTQSRRRISRRSQSEGVSVVVRPLWQERRGAVLTPDGGQLIRGENASTRSPRPPSRLPRIATVDPLAPAVVPPSAGPAPLATIGSGATGIVRQLGLVDHPRPDDPAQLGVDHRIGLELVVAGQPTVDLVDRALVGVLGTLLRPRLAVVAVEIELGR